jgi:adenylate kinase
VFDKKFVAWLKRQRFTIFGAPCAGKTDAANEVAAFLNKATDSAMVKIIDIGEEMRKIHDVDKTRFTNIDSGGLVDTSEFLALVDELCAEARDQNRCLIFTGQPRQIEEARYFIEHRYIKFALYLDVPTEVLWTRSSSRGRNDDTRDAFESRIKTYELKTVPVLSFFESKGVPVFRINADCTPTERIGRILSVLDGYFQTSGVAK